MGRLIDADALIEKLVISHTAHSQNAREASLLNRDIQMVIEQPTAYDVEKVVAELAEADDGYCWMCGGGIDCRTAIDIVKRGGVNE